jgi:hypothetical protein
MSLSRIRDNHWRTLVYQMPTRVFVPPLQRDSAGICATADSGREPR